MKKFLAILIAVSMVMALLAGGFTSIPSAKAKTTYTVTFDSQGGSYTPAPIKGIVYGATITLPKAPTKAGRTFGGWSFFDKKTGIIDSRGNEFDTNLTATTPVTANITVKAVYIVLNSISMTPGAPNSITVVEASSPANSPAFNFTLTGKGFSSTFSLKNQTRTFKNLVPGLYALTMKYMSGWATNSFPSDLGGVENSGLPLTNGMKATSWGETNSAGNTTKYMTFVAGGSYKEFFNNRILHTVTFDAQGGSPTPAPRTIAYGGTISLPMPPTKAGYTFANWNTKAAGTGTTFTATTKVIADITVYAIYTLNFVPGYWYFWNIPGFLKSITFHFPTSILQWQNSNILALGGTK